LKLTSFKLTKNKKKIDILKFFLLMYLQDNKWQPKVACYLDLWLWTYKFLIQLFDNDLNSYTPIFVRFQTFYTVKLTHI